MKTFILTVFSFCLLFLGSLQAQGNDPSQIRSSIEDLYHPEDSIREKAIETLKAIGPEAMMEVFEVFMKGEKQLKGELRAILAAKQIILSYGEEAIIPLIECVNPRSKLNVKIGPDGKVRISATFTIGYEKFRTIAADILYEIGPASIPALLDYLTWEKDSNSQEVSIKALVLFGETILPQINDLVMGDPDRRLGAIEVLKRLKGKGLPHLIDLFQMGEDLGSPFILGKVAEAIGENGQEASMMVPQLLEKAKSSFEKTQDKELSKEEKKHYQNLFHYCLEALGDIGAASQVAIPFLMECSSDPDKITRCHAISSLASIALEGEKVIPILLKGLEESFFDTRKQALRGLGNFKEEALEHLPVVLKMLSDPSDNVAREAVFTLQKLGANSDLVIHHLMETIKNSGGDAKEVSILALGEMGEKARVAIPLLIQTLEKREEYVVPLLCAISLGKLKATEAIPVLEEFGKSPDKDTQKVVEEALKNIRETEEK